MLALTDELDPGQANVSTVSYAPWIFLTASCIQAINPNLTAFLGPEHNGKLIHYFGWADELISPGNAIYYYETVHQFFRANTHMDINDVYRLFSVPGMNHWCASPTPLHHCQRAALTCSIPQSCKHTRTAEAPDSSLTLRREDAQRTPSAQSSRRPTTVPRSPTTPNTTSSQRSSPGSRRASRLIR